MDAETSLYLENIEEYVFDEEKVVTYKWLSQTLEIHVNLAKRLLETFLKEQKKKDGSQLNVTYAVTGTKETKNGTLMTKVAIVSEEGLEDAKSSMKAVLGQHIFSIQKSALKDTNSLFMMDYEITKQNITQTNRFSAICCQAAKARNQADLDRLRESQLPPSTADKSKVNGFGSQQQSSSSKPTLSSSAPKPKKGSLAASFASQSARNKAKEVREDEEQVQEKKQEQKKEEKKEEVKKPKPKGMMAFMGQKKAEKTPSSGPAGDSNEKEKDERFKEEEEVEVDVVKDKKSQQEVNPLRSTQIKDKKKKRLDDSDSDSDDGRRQRTVAKKRRRIIQQESSSEEEEEEDMDDSPIPPTPPPVAEPVESEEEEEEAPPPSKDQSGARTEPSSGSGRRRIRKRVLKSKVSVDEDGCMVTEKVWESESTDASEDEQPPPKAKSPPKKTDQDSDDEGDTTSKKAKSKKTSPPSGKSKQSSLMSFFKKK